MRKIYGSAGCGIASLLSIIAVSAAAAPPDWATVVNNGDVMPDSSKLFNSYSQPSINDWCKVVFRARSKGPGQPVRGIYSRNACLSSTPILRLMTVGAAVPPPNNINATFNEFPAFPRLDRMSGMMASRGQSTPVYRYLLPDGTETRTGTAGIYTNPLGTMMTGAAQLGAIAEFDKFEVPGAPPGTKFDQFPGAPSPASLAVIAFKGNYTVGLETETGVYFRNVLVGRGTAPVQLVANTSTRIPNQPAGGTATFGSTAPPSAAYNKMVFLGTDNEDAPSLGGIYQATLASIATTPQPAPALRTLVGIGAPVPGVPDARFTRLGEGISYTGRYLSFWGAWGAEQRTITLTCPTDGNASLVTYCNAQYPQGYTTTVPVNQGIFVYDERTSTLAAIARTNSTGEYSDFQYWVFSGRPTGVGGSEEEIEEPARWRSSAFAAVSPTPSGSVATAFKASLVDGRVGIYVRPTPSAALRTALEVGSLAQAVDPEAPAGAEVITVGIERDGFRGCRLALTAGMLDPATDVGWAGIYVTDDMCKR